MLARLAGMNSRTASCSEKLKRLRFASYLGQEHRYQQNLSGRKIAIVVLGNQQWPDVKLNLERVLEAVNAATPGSFSEVEIPHKD